MTLGTWGATALVLPDDDEHVFPHWVSPATIHAEVGDGDVQIQRRNAAGDDWTTIETLSEDCSRILDVKNMPAMRILPTGSAQFMVVWAKNGA
jgi:hypothetical protein